MLVGRMGGFLGVGVCWWVVEGMSGLLGSGWVVGEWVGCWGVGGLLRSGWVVGEWVVC